MRRHAMILWVMVGFIGCTDASTGRSADATTDASANATADTLVDGAVADGGPAADADVDAKSKTWTASVTNSEKVDFLFSQGVARIPGGWIFSATNALWRTDESFNKKVYHVAPLPDALTATGYRHIGDIDVADGLLYAAIEQKDFDRNEQAVVRYDAQTLDYVDHILLPQHEAPFMAVAEVPMIAYLSDHYSDDALLRYDVKGDWKPLPKLPMSRKLEHMQGADVAQGAVWLSCDDPGQGIYRVDLTSGAVVQVGSVNRQERVGKFRPEVEGIDATALLSGLLHVLTGEPLKATSWLDHFAVTPPQ